MANKSYSYFETYCCLFWGSEIKHLTFATLGRPQRCALLSAKSEAQALKDPFSSDQSKSLLKCAPPHWDALFTFFFLLSVFKCEPECDGWCLCAERVVLQAATALPTHRSVGGSFADLGGTSGPGTALRAEFSGKLRKIQLSTQNRLSDNRAFLVLWFLQVHLLLPNVT